MIAQEIEAIRSELHEGVRLVAVSKYHPEEAVAEAYDAGQRVFGESHVQELMRKYEALPKDIDWHFIGHLQTNKVKYMAPFVGLIHAVDSVKLLKEIERQGERCQRTINCLLEVHVAQEESKYGFKPNELLQMLDEGEWKQLKYVSINGLMAMASNTDDEERIRQDFQTVRTLFTTAKSRFFAEDANFKEISMGMSHDYRIAMEEGATLVRIGTRIFGNR